MMIKIKKIKIKKSIALSLLIICSLLICIFPLFTTTVKVQEDWRIKAQADIDTYRKSDLTIHVHNDQGDPVPGATVQVEMQKHQFILGTAIALDVFQSNQTSNEAVGVWCGIHMNGNWAA